MPARVPDNVVRSRDGSGGAGNFRFNLPPGLFGGGDPGTFGPPVVPPGEFIPPFVPPPAGGGKEQTPPPQPPDSFPLPTPAPFGMSFPTGPTGDRDIDRAFRDRFLEFLRALGILTPLPGVGKLPKARDAFPKRQPRGVDDQVNERKVLEREVFRENLPVPAGPRRSRGSEEILREQARKRLAKRAAGAIIGAGVMTIPGSTPQTGRVSPDEIGEIVVTPKKRTRVLGPPPAPKRGSATRPKRPKFTLPGVSLPGLGGVAAILVGAGGAAILSRLNRPRLRIVDTAGRVRTPTGIEDVPVGSGLSSAFTGFPLTQSQPRLSESNCQIVQRRRRKKGRCREGFFRETPGRTKYITWRSRKCP